MLRRSANVWIITGVQATGSVRTETGADSYLPKPFDEKELWVCIKQLLDSRAILMEVYSSALPKGEFENTMK